MSEDFTENTFEETFGETEAYDGNGNGDYKFAIKEENENYDAAGGEEEVDYSAAAVKEEHAVKEEYAHIPEFQSFIDAGIDESVAYSIEELCKTGAISAADFQGKTLETIKEFPAEEAIEVLRDINSSTLVHVANKSAYVCGLLKTHKQRKSSSVSASHSHVSDAHRKGPDDAKMKEILEKSGYSMEVTTGQRKYGGPPPNWEGPPPGAGHELFIGKLPKDVYEDDLIPLLEECGQLYDLRIMMDSIAGGNRGYGFAMFVDKDAAKHAVEKLDGFEIRPGKKLKANISVANVRLFVGNIPKTKSREEIMEAFQPLTENLVEVIIYSTPDDPKKRNRGFAFLEYASHKDASMARRKLNSGNVRVWNCEVAVDWAEPQEEPDEKTMQSVKVVYVRNLKNEVTEDELMALFSPFGKIERVRKLKDYGFVHFENRDHALKAIEELNGKDLHGAPMSAQLAKPPTDHKKKQHAGGAHGYGEDYWPPASVHRPPGLVPRRPPRPAAAVYDYDYNYDYGSGYADDYYGGGYDDGSGYYGDAGYYGDYYGGAYAPPPPLRPRARGVVRPPAPFRGRGLPGVRPSAHGLPPGVRGGRGAPGGRGAVVGPRGRGGPRGGRGDGRGAKRKAFGGGGAEQQAPKKRNVAGGAAWGTQPIAQQPLGDQLWYQDTYGAGSWS